MGNDGNFIWGLTTLSPTVISKRKCSSKENVAQMKPGFARSYVIYVGITFRKRDIMPRRVCGHCLKPCLKET